MARAKHSFPILLILLLLVGSMALTKEPASRPSDKLTVGEFALRVIGLAEADPAVRASLTAEEAVARLKQAGLRFRGSPGDALTEGEKSAFFFAVAGGLLDRLAPQPPAGFEACLNLSTVPDCRTCCLALPGASDGSCGRACGQDRAGKSASPSEPTP